MWQEYMAPGGRKGWVGVVDLPLVKTLSPLQIIHLQQRTGRGGGGGKAGGRGPESRQDDPKSEEEEEEEED